MKKILSILFCAVIALSAVFAVGCNESEADLNADLAVTTYNLTVKDGIENGSVELSSYVVEHGKSVEVKIYPTDSSYGVYDLRINGGEADLSKLESISGSKYGYKYTVAAVTNDMQFNVIFAKNDVTVKYAGTTTEIASAQAINGNYYGKNLLPTPVEENKRFIGWYDEGNNVVNDGVKIKGNGEITLTAKFVDLTLAEKAALKPTAMTSSYYDSAATKYGVVWHNYTEAVAPAIIVSKNADFSESVTFNADTAKLQRFNEYVNAAVVSDLEYETTYYAKLGDLCIPEAERATYWSDTFTFTTRKENVDTVNFLYMNSTYQLETNKIKGYDDSYFGYVLAQATDKFDSIDFLAHGGNFIPESYNYENGLWNETLSSIEEYLFNIPIMPTGGYNEVSEYNTLQRNLISAMFNIDTPNNGIGDTGRYYSFDYGPIHFVSIRTNDLYRTSYTNMNIGETRIHENQMAWIKSDLLNARSNPNVKWVVVLMNENPLDPDTKTLQQSSTKVYTELQKYLVEKVTTLFTQNGVDLVLTTSNRSKSLVVSKPLATDSNTLKYSVVDLASSTETGTDGTYTQYTLSADTNATVYYQVGSAGETVGNYYDGSVSGVNGIYYAKALSGKSGKQTVADADLSMYSYVSVTDGKLSVSTYGVDVKSLMTKLKTDATANLSADCYYLDGLALVR